MDMPVGILALVGLIVVAGGGGTIFGLVKGRKAKNKQSDDNA